MSYDTNIKLKPCSKCSSSNIEFYNCGYSSFNIATLTCKDCSYQLRSVVCNWSDKDVYLEMSVKWNNRPKPTKSKEQQRIDKAIKIAFKYGGIDGSHHKDWVIDQMVRALHPSKKEYNEFVRKAMDGEDGPSTYTWEIGIPP